MIDSTRVILAAVCWLLTVTVGGSAEPQIVAHRGLLLHAPENTLANFRACLELRLGFEFDVARTQDGRLVCIHDDTVDRTTDGSGKVSELTLEQLRRLDAGKWFDSKFAGERVPTVEEVLKLVAQYRHYDVLIAVDLKAADVERDVVQLAQELKVLDRLLFIGRTITQPNVRETIKASSPQAQTATVANNPQEFLTALNAPHTDRVYFRYVPPAEQVAAAHRAGKRTFIAGSSVSGNERENWTRASEAGIDAILTDYPLELATLGRLHAQD